MSRQISVQIKNVYGVTTVYPVCDNAKRFAEISGTKTLTERTMKLICELDYEIYEAPRAGWKRAA